MSDEKNTEAPDVEEVEGELLDEETQVAKLAPRAITEMDHGKAFELAANRAMVMQRIRGLVLSNLDPADVTIFSVWSSELKKKVAIIYLNATGSEIAGRTFGISSRLVPFADGELFHKKWDKDPDTGERKYAYHCLVETWLTGNQLETVQVAGYCDTKHKMFKRIKWEGKTKVGEYYLPVGEIDEQTVKGKCETHGFNKAVKRLLGLSRISVKELETAGVKIDESKMVAFRVGKQGGKIPANDSQYETLKLVLSDIMEDFDQEIIFNLKKLNASESLIERVLVYLGTRNSITRIEFNEWIKKEVRK